MLIRHFALPVAVLTAVLACAAPASAQSVFAPADNSANTNTPINPLGDNGSGSSDSGSIFAPAPGNSGAGDVVPVMPRTPAVQQPPSPRAQQQPVPASQRDDFAYRTLGIETPKAGATTTDPLAAYSPEEIANARKGFAALEASNPAMAAHNPFRRIDTMNNTEKAQNAMIARAKTACDVQSFNVLVSVQTFMKDQDAVDGLNKNGVPMIGNAIQDLCSDREMRTKITNSAPLITIVQKERAPLSVTMTDGIITFTSDFAADEPPQPAAVRAALAQAVNEADRFMQGTTP